MHAFVPHTAGEASRYLHPAKGGVCTRACSVYMCVACVLIQYMCVRRARHIRIYGSICPAKGGCMCVYARVHVCRPICLVLHSLCISQISICVPVRDKSLLFESAHRSKLVGVRACYVICGNLHMCVRSIIARVTVPLHIYQGLYGVCVYWY